ncbi:MAG TPA: glutamate--tRNA ligase [Candidatus Omnitrophota bacterium]|nr:glutamate--tRNA ligase [Candidatus Omnitrophota bacterium]
MAKIRLRFAPSPTGSLHIGGVRTALFNYLYAKSQGGKFIVRIEDTDRERSSPEFEKEILDSLAWLGLKSDDAPVRQSEHFPLYQEIAESLIAKDLAYRSKDGEREAIVFRMPKKTVVFQDLVHGEISFDTSTLEDFVLIKSDKSPAYNFACVVDDHEMKITHVIRGDDHISNTPKQIALYEALGYAVPVFGHLPLIHGKDGTPLSKRDGAVSVSSYRESGYLSPALLNYLAILGWAPEGDREIFSLDELVKLFAIEKVNATPVIFDFEKLEWMNGEYIRQMTPEAFGDVLVEYLGKYAGLRDPSEEKRVRCVASLFRERIRKLSDFAPQAEYCLKKEISYDPAAVSKYWKDPKLSNYLMEIAAACERVDFDQPSLIEESVRELAQLFGVHARELIHPLRVAITGKAASPGLFELMSALGRETVVERIRQARQVMKSGAVK